MLLNSVLMILGMFMLIKGGDLLVDGASALARRYKIPELTIGLTIVAFGTSAPEFVISFIAALNSHSEIALGNIIGSYTINLFIVLGITGIIAPIIVPKNTIRYEIPISIFSVILLFFLANYGVGEGLSRIDGIVLLFFFAVFIFYVFKSMKNKESEEVFTKTFSLLKIIIFIVLGLGLLIFGGKIVVDSAVMIARALNISEKIIALTIVAFGTSLPELVTSVTAIIKKSSDIAIGNVIGSNIFNILLILGASAAANHLVYSSSFNKDMYMAFTGTALLFLFTFKSHVLSRIPSLVFVLVYAAYLVYLIQLEMQF